VRVVGEQGFSRGRALAADDPVVARGAVFGVEPDARARALFLLNGRLPELEKSTVTVDKPGILKVREQVGDGEVTLRTDTDFTVTTTDAKQKGGFSIGFGRKAGAGDSRILQIFWAEIIVTRPGLEDFAVNASIKTGDGSSMELTHDDYKPVLPGSNTPRNYKVDSTILSPFYESENASNRDATSTTIFDRVHIPMEIIGNVFDKAASVKGFSIARLAFRVHLNTYLVNEEKPIYRISQIVEYTFTSKTDTPAPKYGKPITAKVTELPADEKAQLVKEHPRYDWIR